MKEQKMKIMFKGIQNNDKNNILKQNILSKLEKDLREETIAFEGSFEIIKSFEFKPDVIRDKITPTLVDYIRIIESNAKQGTYAKPSGKLPLLTNYEDSQFKIQSDTKIEEFYKQKKYELKGYMCLFKAPTYLLDDSELIKSDLFMLAFDITRKTENDIIYNSIIKEPLKNIEITQNKAGEEIKTELEEFCNLAKTTYKKVYMTLNLLSKLEVLSKKINIPLITTNPNILGGKLLCGIPITAFENEVLKPYNQKEIIICGDLHDTFELIRNPNYEVDFTDKIDLGRITTFRILQNYDFKEEKEKLSIAQITIS